MSTITTIVQNGLKTYKASNLKTYFFTYEFKKASAVDETRQISKLVEGQHMWKVSHKCDQRL
jgi:hypothetical protein